MAKLPKEFLATLSGLGQVFLGLNIYMQIGEGLGIPADD